MQNPTQKPMQNPIRITLSVLLAALLLMTTLTLALPAGAAEASASVAGQTKVTVTAEEIESSGACGAIQAALNTAQSLPAGASLKVTVEPGSYDLNGGLVIYGNTCLSLYGVTLTRGGTTQNMLRVSGYTPDGTWAEGYCFSDITVQGGTFDGDGTSNTMIKVAHAQNFTMKDVALRNLRNAHMMEVGGVDGFTVTGCTFTDQVLTPGEDGYEVIQLDILESGHLRECRPEDLAIKNVLIENCAFTNCPRGVGSHTAVVNHPLDTVTIRNNTFTDMTSVAIQTLDWVNCTITGNVIDNCPRAIAYYALMNQGDGSYLASTLAAQGDTAAHVSDSYQAHSSNALIACNTIKNCGALKDNYATYECLGISAIGSRVTGTVSGKPSKGDYFCDGVTIRDNLIDVRGNGIRVEYAKNVTVEGNVIHCTKNTVKPANYYGIVCRNEVSATKLLKNYISNAEVNGIYVKDSKLTSVSLNEIVTTGKYGVGIESSTVETVSNNDVSGTANHGVMVCKTSTVSKTLSQNRIQKAKADGIHIDKDCTVKLAEKNTTLSCSGNIGYTKSAGKVKLGTNYTSSAALTSVKADKTVVTLEIGESFRISKTPTPVNAVTTYTYSSDKSSVASVDSVGRITAKAAGNAKVTVKSANGKTATVTVTVPAPPEPPTEPTTEEPTTEAPTTIEPTTEEPTTAEPTTVEPTTEELTTVESTTVEPTTEESTSAPQPARQLGDVNNDGVVDVTDATMVQMHAGSIRELSGDDFLYADVNHDNVVDITDATYIQMLAAGIM